MRAEGQAHIDRINAATALLRRFLDWDRALKRLEELNARVEDPKLWDDPKDAEEVMRERRRLEEAIGGRSTIERELADTFELIELAEAKAMTRWSRTASAASPSSPSAPTATRSRRCSPAKPTPTTPTSKSTPAPAAPKARTGPRCCCGCIRAGASARHQGRADRSPFGRAGRDQIGDAPDQGRERLWLSEDRKRRPPAGADQPL